MQIRWNGNSVALDKEMTLSDLLQHNGIDPGASYLAAAINDAIVFKAEWPTRILREGDCIEIIHAVQGG